MSKKVLEQIDKELEYLDRKLKLIESTEDYLEISNLMGKIEGLKIARIIVIGYGD